MSTSRTVRNLHVNSKVRHKIKRYRFTPVYESVEGHKSYCTALQRFIRKIDCSRKTWEGRYDTRLLGDRFYYFDWEKTGGLERVIDRNIGSNFRQSCWSWLFAWILRIFVEEVGVFVSASEWLASRETVNVSGGFDIVAKVIIKN